MTGKKFFSIAAIAFMVMTAVTTPLIYVVLFKPKGVDPGADPELYAHLLRSVFWTMGMSLLLLSAYWIGLRMEKGGQKAA